jgi:hypothetical protein
MKLPPGIMDGGDDRLAGKQIVTEKDRPKVSDRATLPGQPAFRGVAFAILLFRPVLRRDELGGQWEDLLVAWCGQAGTAKSVEVFVPPSARRRVEHCVHLILREQWCSGPSSAISTYPSRHRNGVSGPAASIALKNSRSNAAGAAPSSIVRM